MGNNNTKITEVLVNNKYWNQFKTVISESVKKEQSKTSKNQDTSGQIFNILLENVRKSFLQEDFMTTGTSVQPVVRSVLGLTKKMFPKLVQNEIVSVQPMTGPLSVVKIKKVKIDNQEVPDFLNNQNSPDYLGSDRTQPKQISVSDTEIQNGANEEINLIQNDKIPGGRIVPGSVSISYNSNSNTIYEVNGRLISTNGDVVGIVDYNQGTVTVYNNTGDDITVTVSQNVIQEQFDQQHTPTMTFEIENQFINQLTRRLNTQWTYEQQEDWNQEIGSLINFEDELYNDQSSFIQQEINREIISDLLTNVSADQTVKWEYKEDNFNNFLTAEQYFRTLLYKINQVQQKVTRKTQVSPNFIVLSPLTWQLIQDGLTPYVSSTMQQNQINFQDVGYQNVGTINQRYQVIVTPSISDTDILVGYKGQSIIDSGYVYQPYVPLKQVPVPYLTPTLRFYTRYGKKMYQPWFYGKVEIEITIP